MQSFNIIQWSKKNPLIDHSNKYSWVQCIKAYLWILSIKKSSIPPWHTLPCFHPLVHSILKDHVANWTCQCLQPCSSYNQKDLAICWVAIINDQLDSTTSCCNVRWETSCCKAHWDEKHMMPCALGNFLLESA